MRNSFWDDLLKMIRGESPGYKPVGFIIDSPWIPGWYRISNMNYYSSDKYWFRANIEASERFPDVWFMPGFWQEYGMCTEPSAFGARMIWMEQNLPHAEKILDDISEVDRLPVPDVKTDGLLPFVISRLRNNEEAIKKAGHQIRFAVSRGPLNIASFLLGTTGFMMSLAIDPERSHILLRKISDFICEWLMWQKKCFPSIDGVLILDDIIGFVGENEFNEFVIPYLRRIFDCTGTGVRFLHNDAEGLITAGHLKDMNVNMFNFSYTHSMDTIRKLAGPGVVLVGNIPPRDVMAAGTPGQVAGAVEKAMNETEDHSMIIWSCGGGMPPGVPDANIKAFAETVKYRS